MRWSKALARMFGRRPKGATWEEVAVTTYLHLRHKRTWREGAEERIRAEARSLAPSTGVEAGITLVSQIVQAEILPEPPHA